MAEENKTNEQKPVENQVTKPEGAEKNQENIPTIEELAVQLKQAQAEILRSKNSMDKVMSENKALKDQLRQKMSAEEQVEQAKKEADEQQAAYVKSLEQKLAKIDAQKRYMDMGMDSALAEATAEAELKGERDAVTANIKKMTDALLKAKEAEWLRTRPSPQAGGEGTVTKEQFDRMTLAQKSELYERDPALYHKLLGR